MCPHDRITIGVRTFQLPFLPTLNHHKFKAQNTTLLPHAIDLPRERTFRLLNHIFTTKFKLMKLAMTIVGWSGVLFCTLGYLLLSMKVIKSDSLSFQILNVLGGGCLAVTALDTNDLPNVAANLLWMGIGLYALISIFKKQKQRQDQAEQ